jgi:DNA-binding transcriptional MocR family regulator
LILFGPDCGTTSPTNNTRWPNQALLPTRLLDKAAHRVLNNDDVAFPSLWYGPDHGDLRLRKHVAAWLSAFYRPSHVIPLDRIVITGGASQNLASILQISTDPVYTRNAWIVAPAYHLSFRIFDDAGLHKKLRAVPEDSEGLDIEFLKAEIGKSEDKAKQEGNNEPVCAVTVLDQS